MRTWILALLGALLLADPGHAAEGAEPAPEWDVRIYVEDFEVRRGEHATLAVSITNQGAQEASILSMSGILVYGVREDGSRVLVYPAPQDLQEVPTTGEVLRSPAYSCALVVEAPMAVLVVEPPILFNQSTPILLRPLRPKVPYTTLGSVLGWAVVGEEITVRAALYDPDRKEVATSRTRTLRVRPRG